MAAVAATTAAAGAPVPAAPAAAAGTPGSGSAASGSQGVLIGDRLYSGVLITLENCLLPDDKLRFTPSMSSGLDTDTETDLRVVGCELIQAAGILLRLPQVGRGREPRPGTRRAAPGAPTPDPDPASSPPGPALPAPRPGGGRAGRRRAAGGFVRAVTCRGPLLGRGPETRRLGEALRVRLTGTETSLFQVAMATGQVLFQRFFYTKSFVKHSMEVRASSSFLPAGLGGLRAAPRRECLPSSARFLTGWVAPQR